MDSQKSPPPYDASTQPQGAQEPVVHYAHQPAAPANVTVLPGVAIAATQAPLLGSEPQTYTCKSCNMQIVTQVRHKASTKTHLFALCLCCIGFVLCFWIPYCINSCKNIDHYCPNCQSYVGSYGDNKLI